MALKRITRRKRASITSLIDVIFLLLLFFMLASTFSKFSELDISAAGPGSAASETPDILELRIGAHHLHLNGAVLPAHGWAEAVRAKQTDNTVVALSVDESISTQRMTDVLVELNEISGLQVYVVEAP